MFGLKKQSETDIRELRRKLRREFEIQIASGFEEQLIQLSKIDKMSDEEVRRACKRYHIS